MDISRKGSVVVIDGHPIDFLTDEKARRAVGLYVAGYQDGKADEQAVSTERMRALEHGMKFPHTTRAMLEIAV